MPFLKYKDVLDVAIAKLDVVGSFINHLHGLQQVDYNYMAFCLTNHISDMHDIREVLHKRLLSIGRENYKWLTSEAGAGKSPDDAPSPVALAYAIEYGEITEAEAASILFDNNDTAESFLLDKRRKLLDSIVQQIVDGINSPKGSP